MYELTFVDYRAINRQVHHVTVDVHHVCWALMALLTLKVAVGSIDLVQVDQNRIDLAFYIQRLFFLFPISL